MKAIIIADNLKKKITYVFHAVSQRAQLPILLNFLIVAKNGLLTISATDLEIGIVAKIPAKIEEEGGACVPAKTFSDLVASLTSEKIKIELAGSTLVLSGVGIRAVFSTSDSSEFPKIVADAGKVKASIKKELLDREMSKVVFAASLDMGRPALSGVFVKKEAGGFTAVATDGYRLSLKKNLALSDASAVSQALVPSRVIKELALLGDSDKNVDVYVSEENNQIVFVVGDTTLVGRLIDAEFPDYEKIIPQDFGTKSIFDRSEMLDAVKQGSVFAREASNIIKLSVKKDKIVVSANAPSVGEDWVEVSAKTQGEENEIAFNARYLLDLLGSMDDENLTFEMTGPLNPGVFKSEKDTSFLHLIMPIRVQG